MSTTLPRDVERFLVEYIDSIAQLEILVLLHRAPDIEFPATAVARELGVDAAWALRELGGLAGRGLLAERGNGAGSVFRFHPADPQLGALIDRVVQTFRERRLAVVDLVVTKPSRHILGFADAFRIRKD